MNQEQEKIKELVDGYRQEMLDLWRELVNFQAGSKEGQRMRQLLGLVSDRLQQEGMESELVETSCEIPMLRAYFHKERLGKPILISGHLDTVFPNGSYPENPFTIKDGKAYGPGVCDMKGGAVMGIYIVKILDKLGYDKHPFKLVFVGDEETTHLGSNVAEMLAEEGKGCLCAFNMETGRMDNCLTVARKGCMDVWITTHGKAGHVGNDYARCANAIEAMAHIIVELRKLTNLEEGLIVSTDIVSGGVVSNAIPAECRIEVDCRFDHNSDKAMLQEKIKAICAKTYVPGCRADVEFPSSMPVFEHMDGNDELLALVNEAAADYGLPPFGSVHPGGCSDASFMALAGIPILDSLGVQGDGEHTLEEFANVETMFQRTMVLCAAISCLD